LTAISDIEVEHKDDSGEFVSIKYGDDDLNITIATTRAETMLGDGAVAVNPNDERYKHLVGKKVLLPLVDRMIPIIADELVDPDFGTGAVKVTAAHDPNDFEMGMRHGVELVIIMNEHGVMEGTGTKFDGIFGTTSTRGFNQIDQGHFDQNESMPWLTGCCILIKNEVVKTFSPTFLNERYKTYFEDVEFSFRLRKAGYELMYVPSSKIWHIAGYSAERNKDKEGKKFPEIVYLHTRNKIWIARAYSLPLTRPLAMLWQYGYCLLLLGYYAIKGRWKKYNKVIQAMQDGWRSQPC
jgi:hypothetical protein